MLWTGDRVVVSGGTTEGCLEDWETTWEPSFLGRKVLAFHLGDPVAGPLVFLTHIPSSHRTGGGPCRPWSVRTLSHATVFVRDALRAAVGRAGRHFHRTDTFHLVVGDGPEDWLCFNGRRMAPGDYRVQPANVPYREWYGSTGCIELVVDADRRGHPPIDKSLARVEDAEAVRAAVAGAGSYVSKLGDVHVRNENAVSRVASTVAGTAAAGGLQGSVHEDGWAALRDGSSVAAIVIGHSESGPLAVLSRNAPGALEAPPGAYRTEMLRLVLKGSVSLGDRSYGAGEWRLTAANVTQDAVVHGPEGSTQLVLFADRRHWHPVDQEQANVDVVARLEEMRSAVARLVGDAGCSSVAGRRT